MISVTLGNGASFKVSKQNVIRFYDSPSGSGTVFEYNSQTLGNPVIAAVTEASADIQTASSTWFLSLTLSSGTIYLNPLKVISVSVNGSGSAVEYGTDQFTTGVYYASESTTDVATVIDAAFSSGGALPYTSYVALLSQSSTDAPTDVIINNEFGSDPVLAYSSTGAYTLTLAGAFTLNKTFAPNVIIGQGEGGVSTLSISRISNDTLQLITSISGANSDGLLSNTPVEIRVYN